MNTTKIFLFFFFQFSLLPAWCNKVLSPVYLVRFAGDNTTQAPIQIKRSMGFLEFPKMGISYCFETTTQADLHLQSSAVSHAFLWVNSDRESWLDFLELCWAASAGQVFPEPYQSYLVEGYVRGNEEFWLEYPTWKQRNYTFLEQPIPFTSPQEQSSPNISSPHPIDVESCIKKWKIIGHFLYPVLLEDQIDYANAPVIGKGGYGTCFRIPRINAIITYFHQPVEAIGLVVYKQLNSKLSNALGVEKSDNFPDLSEINFFIGHSSRPFGSHSVVLRREVGDKFRVCGFISDLARYGSLWAFVAKCLSSNSHLSVYFIRQLKELVHQIHRFHTLGVLHRDLSISNVFVAHSATGYSFVVSDFGMALPKGIVRLLRKKPGYDRGNFYPLEFFEESLSHLCDERSDWYQFGWILKYIANALEQKKRRIFLAYFHPLIEMITALRPENRTWNYADILSYFDMILSAHYSCTTLNDQGFVRTISLAFPLQEPKIMKFIHQLNGMEMPTPSFKRLVGESEILYKMNVEFHSQNSPYFISICDLVMNPGNCQLEERPVSLEIPKVLPLKPLLFRFIEDYPWHVIGSVTNFIRRPFYKGHLISISTTTLNSFCICQDTCCLMQTEVRVNGRCRHLMSHQEFENYINCRKKYIEPV